MAVLNDKQRTFAEEYIVDLNATQAAIRAGYSEKTAGSQAFDLLKKPEIQEYIQHLMDERSKRTEITADAVLGELAKLGFGNIKNLYTDGGSLASVHDLPEEVTATIVEVTEDLITKEGEDAVLRRKYKVADKKSSLELLGKHLKLFTDKIEHTGKDNGPIEFTNTERAARLAALLERGRQERDRQSDT